MTKMKGRPCRHRRVPSRVPEQLSIPSAPELRAVFPGSNSFRIDVGPGARALRPSSKKAILERAGRSSAFLTPARCAHRGSDRGRHVTRWAAQATASSKVIKARQRDKLQRHSCRGVFAPFPHRPSNSQQEPFHHRPACKAIPDPTTHPTSSSRRAGDEPEGHRQAGHQA